jgi:hypothetical protein
MKLPDTTTRVSACWLTHTASQEVVSAFWTPQDTKGQQTFGAMLCSGVWKKSVNNKVNVKPSVKAFNDAAQLGIAAVV